MKLVLENGLEFCGKGFGADRPAVGEIVFNTSMVGYQEILSDPSYAGQIVLMTYPIMGQYGITDEDYESRSAGPAGLVVRENCQTPSNFRYTKTLSEDLDDHHVPGIEGLDTRMITRIIRDNGPMRAAIVPDGTPLEEALEMIRTTPVESNPIAKVSCSKRWFSRIQHHNYDVVLLDCGLKHSIITALNNHGCNVTVVPWNSTADEIMAFRPDGVLLSSGPGDPHDCQDITAVVNALKGRVPIVGIGLGFELLALSCGLGLERLKCGIHGGCPVRKLSTGKIITVEQNCGYAIDESTLAGKGLEVTYRNVADGRIAGFDVPAWKISAVQFYAEGGPGPEESDFFDCFIKAMED